MAHLSSQEHTSESSTSSSMEKSSQNSPNLESGLLPQDNSNIVTWSGPDDPSNPINWHHFRKWTATILVSSFTFISPLSSTMVAPALDTMGSQFNVTNGTEQYLMMSIFLLAYSIGPFVIAPLSEMLGRVIVLQSANLVFLVFNLVCGFAQSSEQMLAFRFLSGLGASAPQSIGGGVLSDCWRKEERGAATALYSLMPFLGPVIGPIAGGYLTQFMSWRWIFWIVSIADVVVQILACFFLGETYAPAILAAKRRKLRKETGNDQLHTEYDHPDRSLGQTLRKNLTRPLLMLTMEPSLQALALIRGYQYGLMYLVLASFPIVWEDVYKEPTGTASLNYLSLGVGFVLGLQFCGRVLDILYARLKRHYKHDGKPEFRVPLMIPGGLFVSAGLFIYGWTAQYQTHWIIPNIGAAVFAFGLIISFQCAQTYVIDAYSRYAASATGAAAFVRTMMGFGFPLFADSLYDRLGLGWGNSVLGFVSLALGLVAPVLLWFFGGWLRSKSRFAGK